MSGEIGVNIVKCRRLKGMSQKHLAAKVGLSSQGLFKIEKGIVSPRVSTVEKICDVLAVTPNQLLGFEQISEEEDNLAEKLRKMHG